MAKNSISDVLKTLTFHFFIYYITDAHTQRAVLPFSWKRALQMLLTWSVKTPLYRLSVAGSCTLLLNGSWLPTRCTFSNNYKCLEILRYTTLGTRDFFSRATRSFVGRRPTCVRLKAEDTSGEDLTETGNRAWHPGYRYTRLALFRNDYF